MVGFGKKEFSSQDIEDIETSQKKVAWTDPRISKSKKTHLIRS